MTHWLAQLAATAAPSRIAFVAIIVFAVAALELYRSWSERRSSRGGRAARAAVGLVLGLVFSAMLVVGIAGHASGGELGFLELGLFLTGAASLAILGQVAWRAGRLSELRRSLAEDL